MNELIDKLIKMKKKVGVFPIQENEWQDLSKLSFRKPIKYNFNFQMKKQILRNMFHHFHDNKT